MCIKRLFSLFVLASFPLVASADLTIENHTKFDSTSIINGGACSNALGEPGISRGGLPPLVVPDSLIKLACGKEKINNCVADVYMTNNCSGKKVGTVKFSIISGTLSVTQNPDSPFRITSAIHSFKFSLDGGPTA